MLDLLFNVYNLKEYLNNNSFKMYIVGSNWTYYYWFIDVEKTKLFTLNMITSNEFREDTSILIEPWKYFPFKNKDKIFLSYNGSKVLSMLNRTYNRDVVELEHNKLPVNWLKFFNMIKY